MRKTAIKRERIEQLLDAGYGECFLAKPEIAPLIEKSLLHFDAIRYSLHEWVIMPNHVHLLLTVYAEFTLRFTIGNFKSYTAQVANGLLQRQGQFWYPEFYDRYIRTAQHYENVVYYIHNNPVKAGLCAEAKQWEFSSARRRL
jgi:REP element-mobilizing transposase RayT